jgi:UrcA family protein
MSKTLAISKTLAVIAAVALASALIVPTVSQAAQRNSVRVSYADLNLATNVGQDKLQTRIAYASTLVCDTGFPLELGFMRVVRDCREATIADAQPAFEAAVANARRPSVEVIGAAALIVTAH